MLLKLISVLRLSTSLCRKARTMIGCTTSVNEMVLFYYIYSTGK